MLATLTLRALLLLGEPSPRFSRRPLTFRVACRHPQPPPCGESLSYAPLSRSHPTYAVGVTTTDSTERRLAPPARSSGSVAFRRRIRREPTCQSRTCAPAVKRLRSQGPERLPPYRPFSSLHPKTTPPWIRIWITRTTRTPFRRWVLPQAASGGYPRSPSTSAQVTHTALRRCMTHARDACDRFLPSTASISSTRVSFALGEVPASRLRTTSVSACAARPETNIRAPSGFTPPEWLWWMSNDILRSSNHCRACRASSMCQLADPSVVAHTSKLRLERCATWSVKTSPFCDLARLPSKSAFLRPTSCDACRAPPGVDLMSRACPAFVGFAANVPSSTPFHRYDAMLLSQTRLYRLGPRSHPRIWLMRMLLWAET